jgi:hypothetical protein
MVILTSVESYLRKIMKSVYSTITLQLLNSEGSA